MPLVGGHTICEECGRKLGKIYWIPLGFRIICQDCYVDFKMRRSPEQMHYVLKKKREVKHDGKTCVS